MIALNAIGKQKELIFLRAHYANMEFLFSRAQFASSSELKSEKRIKSPIRYISSFTQYNEQVLPIFDFNSYLENVFGARAETDNRMLLVLNISSLSDSSKGSLSGLNLKHGSDVQKLEYFGIKIVGTSEIIVLRRNEMMILPPLMKEVQNKRGILGLRFLEDGKIQYILDLEIILLNNILHKQEEAALSHRR
jgi:hypothetical protein